MFYFFLYKIIIFRFNKEKDDIRGELNPFQAL